jgi:hypothetical protein
LSKLLLQSGYFQYAEQLVKGSPHPKAIGAAGRANQFGAGVALAGVQRIFTAHFFAI